MPPLVEELRALRYRYSDVGMYAESMMLDTFIELVHKFKSRPGSTEVAISFVLNGLANHDQPSE